MAINGGSFLSGSGGTTSVAQQSTQSATLPSQKVAQFKNQQISGVLNGQTPLTNQQGQTPSPTDTSTDPVTASLDRQQQMVSGDSTHNNLLALYAQAKAKKAAAAATAAPVSSVSTAGSSPSGSQFATGGNLNASYNKTYNTNNGLSAARNKALADATSYLGTPYKLGGLSHNAIDCSGLVEAVYSQFGLNAGSHNARIQGQVMGQRTSVANLRPGDLVAWNNGSHIAIYAGNGYIIEAANPRVGTVKRKLWSNAVYGVRLQLPGE